MASSRRHERGEECGVFSYTGDRETLPRQYARKVPLCMNQYRYIFSTVRKPGADQDHLFTFHGMRHAVVFVRDTPFEVMILDENEEPLAPEMYVSLLHSCANLTTIEEFLRKSMRLRERHLHQLPTLLWDCSLPIAEMCGRASDRYVSRVVCTSWEGSNAVRGVWRGVGQEK